MGVLDVSSLALRVALFGSAWAGVPYNETEKLLRRKLRTALVGEA